MRGSLGHSVGKKQIFAQRMTEIGAKIRASLEHFDLKKQITGQRRRLKLIKQQKQI